MLAIGEKRLPELAYVPNLSSIQNLRIGTLQLNQFLIERIKKSKCFCAYFCILMNIS